MSVLSDSDIVITDNDIDEAEKLFGNLSFDSSRREVIKCLDSKDVQAFPGTGKTTVLVAKLAILAKKWPYDNKGICVLSHTNAARDEIEMRLGKTEIGKKLLSYPHFIGTVHSFFNTFIALPWLRSNGYAVKNIDRDYVLKNRFSKLNDCSKNYFEHKHLDENDLEIDDFPIKLNIECGEHSPTYKDVYSIVNSSLKNGHYTYDEMLYISKYVLKSLDFLHKIVQTRFPVLFIDEAQDTDSLQWEVINRCFMDAALTIKQSFGDANQAIFNSINTNRSCNVFPSDNHMTISNSLRFGNSVAKLADPLGVISRGMTGTLEKYDRLANNHTIFLFDKQHPYVAISAYAELVLNCFSDEELSEAEPLGCYVLGMVHNKEALEKDDPHYPQSLKDYWNRYNPNSINKNTVNNYLIDYFRNSTSDLYSKVENLCHFLRQFIIFKVKMDLPRYGKAYNVVINYISEPKRKDFKRDLLGIVKLPIRSEEEWRVAATLTQSLVRNYFGQSMKESFLSWKEDGETERQEKPSLSRNNVLKYISPDSGRSLNLHFASVHSVKGKNQLATLVVDTFWHDRNIKSILPWLCNNPPKSVGSQSNTRLKCHYVALTRARALVCMAMCKDSVTKSQIDLLKQVGWNVVCL